MKKVLWVTFSYFPYSATKLKTYAQSKQNAERALQREQPSSKGKGFIFSLAEKN